MADEVSQDQSNFNSGFSFATFWSVVFFSLDSVVMIISLVINLCLLRAIAANRLKETPVYFFLVFIFFTSLVDDALLIEYFMTTFGHQAHTTTICRLLTFTSIGNQLLKVFTVVSMIYYAWISMEYKSVRIEQTAQKYFPFVVCGLILLEVFFTLEPTLNVKGSKFSQYCYYVDSSNQTLRKTGWLFMVLFPFFIPLAISVFPFVRIGLKLKQGLEGNLERQLTQLKIIFTCCGTFYLFHLLYYILMFGREVEASILDKSDFRRMLGYHIWYITRPMFNFISLGWHILTPLLPFIFDDDLVNFFPGNLVNQRRKERKMTHQESMNSIGLQETSQHRAAAERDQETEITDSSCITTQVSVHSESNWKAVENPFDDDTKTSPRVTNMVDHRESNQTIS